MNQTELKNFETSVADIVDKLSLEYTFLNNWTVSLDHAKKRAGVCKIDQKEISISRHHILNNSSEVVEDTILHEFAHAICYELYKDVSHGKRWKAIALQIGATPKATGRFCLPEAKWYLVLVCFHKKTIKKIASRYRRTKGIKNYFIKNQPDTQGRLFYLDAKEFDLFESKKIKFEDLKIIQ